MKNPTSRNKYSAILKVCIIKKYLFAKSIESGSLCQNLGKSDISWVVNFVVSLELSGLS